MRDSLVNMVLGDTSSLEVEDLATLAVIVAVAVGSSLAGFIACFCWFRREQNRFKKEILKTISTAGREPDGIFLTGSDAEAHGELIAQFKVNYGKQVVSILESEGKRFIHVDGELSPKERAKMIHYLKSEGFVS
jgi:hypothetical protein